MKMDCERCGKNCRVGRWDLFHSFIIQPHSIDKIYDQRFKSSKNIQLATLIYKLASNICDKSVAMNKLSETGLPRCESTQPPARNTEE